MKKWTIISVCLMVGFLGLAYAVEGEVKPKEDTEDDVVQSICPKTLIKDNYRCADCHVVIKDGSGYKYGIKEVDPNAVYILPYNTKIIDGKLRYYLDIVRSGPFEEFLHYAYTHPEFGKHLLMEVDTFGGSVFQAWRIKALIVEAEKRGYTIETRTRGVALSAGFIIFVSGTIGHRSVDPNAEFMMHELWGIEWPKIATPASKEEEARTFRHLQDNINKWIASRGDMTKEEIDTKLKFKEAWLTGEEMLRWNFADKYIGDDTFYTEDVTPAHRMDRQVELPHIIAE